MNGGEEQGRPRRMLFFSHESTVEGIWAAAARNWKGLLSDEGVWLIASPQFCVKTQREFKSLEKEVNLASFGLQSRPAHLLVPDKACYSRGSNAHFHVWKEFFPPHSFIRVHERVLISTPYFAVMQIAAARRTNRLSRQEALAAAEEDRRVRSALGIDGAGLSENQLVEWANIKRFVRATQVLTDFQSTYRYVSLTSTGSDVEYDVIYQIRPLILPENMAAYLDDMGPEKSIMRTWKVCKTAYTESASPMETLLALMLTLPVEMGGFGLPRPTLNREIPIRPEERELVGQEAIIADLSWTDQHVIAEYYGWKDHAGAGSHKVAEDCVRNNSLTALGWQIVHVTYDQIKTVEGFSLLARQLAILLHVELQEPTDLERLWRSRLLALLMPKTSREE